jgi:hypothetical protein
MILLFMLPTLTGITGMPHPHAQLLAEMRSLEVFARPILEM